MAEGDSISINKGKIKGKQSEGKEREGKRREKRRGKQRNKSWQMTSNYTLLLVVYF